MLILVFIVIITVTMSRLRKIRGNVAKDYRKTDPFYSRESDKYSNPVPSREYIMQCLDEMGQAVSLRKLIDLFEIKDEDQQEALRRRLIAMERDAQVMRNRRGNYALVDQLDLIRGRVIGHKDGYGFLVPDQGGEDIYLTPYQMRSLFHGDVVLARQSTSSRGRSEGIVVEVLERNTHQVVGRYFVEGNASFVQPYNKKINQDIIIPAGEADDAKPGQYVVAEILTQPSTRRQATGRIVEILGDHLSPGMEIEVSIRSHNLPHQWSKELQKEIASWKNEVSEADKQDRVDIRKLPLVTIDGEDAKDFDDAVYCEPVAKGEWRLIVAIADVGHYVKPNTALDMEAESRGTSVYFPGRVIPMLPELLSNELCSLKPQVDRLAMVCDMVIDAEGKLSRYKFYEAVIRSWARLTYTQVSDLITGKNKTANALLPHLLNLYKLYKQLHYQRENRGALSFDRIETRIVFGKNKKIKEIVPVIRNDAHRIIEECMLIANTAAAKFLGKAKIPFLYRVHEGPNPEKLNNLRDFLKGIGLRLGGGDNPSSNDYAKLLKRIEGRNDAHLIETVLLRSLMQAVYSPENTGHFGLAYDVYTHFTSPIRRYPDLLTHRALRHTIQGKKKQNFYYDLPKMIQFGEHTSMTERRADDATQEAVTWLKCHYMQDKLGQVFTGVITGVTGFGVFVELENIYVEGLVHITSLKNDYYQHDPIKHYLKGKRTNTIYRLGDPIRVLVARVNLDDRQIDFELA
jgi:ribonuclease R